MRSSLYECVVRHERSEPKAHAFRYRIFVFALDSGEIDSIAKRIPFVSRNRFNLFSFHDADHVDPAAALREHGAVANPRRVLLITSLRVFGYVFNPVSFHFCFDDADAPLAVVAEVNNTFGETKSYVLGQESLQGTRFAGRRWKDFYISPFVAPDAALELRLAVPGERLMLTVSSIEGDRRAVRATIAGHRRPLTAWSLALMTLIYPFVTLKVIAAIHWEALRLWLRGVPFYRKNGPLPETAGPEEVS